MHVQTTDELNIIFVITSMEPFHQSFDCHINFDRTKHKVYISFQISRRVFLGL